MEVVSIGEGSDGGDGGGEAYVVGVGGVGRGKEANAKQETQQWVGCGGEVVSKYELRKYRLDGLCKECC